MYITNEKSINESYLEINNKIKPLYTRHAIGKIKNVNENLFRQLLGEKSEEEFFKLEPITLCLKTDEESYTTSLLGILGEGGCKIALHVDKGRALIIPNMSDSLNSVVERWERIVSEEVKMCEILGKLGLLSPNYLKVDIFSSDNNELAIPGYISKSFDQMAKEDGCFILDTKNPESSSWKKGTHFIFESNNERFEEKNWDNVLDLLIEDISKIFLHGIDIPGDALNIAIVKKEIDLKAHYHVRFFGFDFTNKYQSLVFPEIEKKSDKKIEMSATKRIVDSILFLLFEAEFFKCGEDVKSLRESLVEKLSIKIHDKCNLSK